MGFQHLTTLKLTLHVTQAGERLDHAVIRALHASHPGIPRARVKGWFDAARVFLIAPSHPGTTAAIASQSLGLGSCEIQICELSADDLSSPQARASLQGSFLPVLFEDERLLVLDKPSGIPTLPHESGETETAVGSALAHFPALLGMGRQGLEPGLLHRLDTGTSGCLAFAKTQASFDHFRKIWKTPAIRKYYRALVPGISSAPGTVVLPHPPHTIRTDLGASEKSAKRMLALLPGKKLAIRGRPQVATTHLLKVMKTSDGLQDLELEIETGVRHQIRCHLAALGFPILGDPVYGSAQLGALNDRLWLHAWKLELPLPNGKNLVVQANLPEGWPAPKGSFA